MAAGPFAGRRAALRGFEALPGRFGRSLAGMLAACALLAGPVAAQDAAASDGMAGAMSAPSDRGQIAGRDGDGMSGSAVEAPLILAPEDAGRQLPTASSLLNPDGLTESGGVNGFAPMDAAPPVTAGLPSDTLPVVVELFTAQGCSSCPPADAMLSMLAGQGDVLPLSYHVDYWDYLGWADSFARPEFTERQGAYARAVGERSVYTPQMIVAGQDTSVAPGPAQLMGLIDAHRFAPAALSVQRERVEAGETIELMPLSDLGGSVDVVLVRYAPERLVEVHGGENSGRTVIYTNVVLGLQHLSRWDGSQPLHLTVRPEHVDDDRFPTDTRHALLVQQMLTKRHLPGPILAAIRLD
ncbi:thioredoxin family protein [Paracoccus nototheniae]|uniref:DUF1223 domain-containing protein n=1 Tax=Paracoccus nototheniae TaxID=2489002 RepID=A0ABW4DWI1_9RHOB|nr:DUF1223 domain-containing protein [Paracoccus nototheniae]